MKYTQIKPYSHLSPYIDCYWELKGDENDSNWERIFPDGCPGLVINLGEACKTDNGLVTMDYGKTFLAGVMTSFKESFVASDTHLMGVCFKPAAFSSLYKFAPLNEFTNDTIQFDHSLSLDPGKLATSPVSYLNQYFMYRAGNKKHQLNSVLEDIRNSKGRDSVYNLARRNFMTVRQLERNFQLHIGISPKEYTNIIRFQSALRMLADPVANKSLSDIAFECGYYDNSHLTKEVKRYTGLSPSQI